MKKPTTSSSEENMIPLKTHENHKKTSRTVWEHFDVLRERDRVSEEWRHRVDKVQQCLRIIFILCSIIITIKFSSKAVSLLQSTTICLIKSLLQAYDLDSKRIKFNVRSAYFFLKLKVSSVERLSQNDYTWTTMLSTFIAFEVRFRDETRQSQWVTILTEKREKRPWELNLFSILKMVEFLSRHTDIRSWAKRTLTYVCSKELVSKERRMVLQSNLNRLNLTGSELRSLQS